MAPHRAERGERYYRAALAYAQSLWMEGKPAQSILQLNKAWSADLRGDEPVLDEWPPPYGPLCWLLVRGGDHGFLGNPVRHFQHLASRMSGPHREARVWRSWACFHLAEKWLDPAVFPRDHEQIRGEGLRVPSVAETEARLARLCWSGEAERFRQGLDGNAAVHRSGDDPVARPGMDDDQLEVPVGGGDVADRRGRMSPRGDA